MPNTKPYLVTSYGCCDSTKIIVHLTEGEKETVTRLAQKITANGGGCSPVMYVHEVEETDEEWADYVSESGPSYNIIHQEEGNN